jgi:hypothetical protein
MTAWLESTVSPGDITWTAAARRDSTAIPEPECTSPPAAIATHRAALASCSLVSATPMVAAAVLRGAGDELSDVPDTGADEAAGVRAAQAVNSSAVTGNTSNRGPSRPWEIQSRPCLMIINYPPRPLLVPQPDATNVRLNKHSLFARTRTTSGRLVLLPSHIFVHSTCPATVHWRLGERRVAPRCLGFMAVGRRLAGRRA